MKSFKHQAGEDLVWPERPHIGLPAGPRESVQAQASAKDRSVSGIHTYVVCLDTKHSALPGPALICHDLSVPKLALPYPAWAFTV